MQGFDNYRSHALFVAQVVNDKNQEIRSLYPERKIHTRFVDACTPDDIEVYPGRLLLTSNWVAPGVISPDYHEQLPMTWYGMYADKINIESVTPTKDFNCFINRMDPIRQSWLYQLIRRNVFDRGYVSFNMDISRHIMLNQYREGITATEIFENQFENQLKIFQPEHDYIKHRVPYRNFNDDSLDSIIMQSKFSIVLETYFLPNDVITYSEKIFRCLRLPRPWVLFAHPGSVEYLRRMGFDVLDDVVDHSYDQLTFEIDRQVAVLDQTEKLCQLEITNTLDQRLQSAAQHNQKLLFDFLAVFKNDMTRSIESAKSKCLRLV